MAARLKYPHLDLSQTNSPYMAEMMDAACRVIKSGRYIGGDEVDAFESAMCRLCNTPFAIGVASGLDALRLILMAYVELGTMHTGDEVIVPANTYIASFLAISQAGLIPVPADPDPTTMNLSHDNLRQALTPRTKAIMPVHLYGRTAWDSGLKSFAEEHNLLVIEDTAQAIGARSSVPGIFGTYVAGGLGHASGLSFYPTKNLGAAGDAGMVVTHSKDIADAVRALANYGSDRRYHNIYQGLNSRLDPIQAAILNVKAKYLDNINNRRIEIARIYNQRITNPAIIKPQFPAENCHVCVWHQYVVRVPGNRDCFRSYLENCGVGSDIHYPAPPHMQPCYSTLKHKSLPVSEMLAKEIVSLPISEALTDEQAIDITCIINDFKPQA